MSPFDVKVDFHLILTDALTLGRGIDDLEVRGCQQRQAKLFRKCIRIVLNGRRTAPVKNHDGLSRSCISLSIESGQIVGSLNRSGRVAATCARQALQIDVVARVGSDRKLAVIVGRKLLRLDIEAVRRVETRIGGRSWLCEVQPSGDRTGGLRYCGMFVLAGV